MRVCGSTNLSFTKCFLVSRSYLKSLSTWIEGMGVDNFSIDALKLVQLRRKQNDRVSKSGKFAYRSLRIYQIWRITGFWGFTVFVREDGGKPSVHIFPPRGIQAFGFWRTWGIRTHALGEPEENSSWWKAELTQYLSTNSYWPKRLIWMMDCRPITRFEEFSDSGDSRFLIEDLVRYLYGDGKWTEGVKTELGWTFGTWKHPRKVPNFVMTSFYLKILEISKTRKFGSENPMDLRNLDESRIWDFLIFDESLRFTKFIVHQMLSRVAQLSKVTV